MLQETLVSPTPSLSAPMAILLPTPSAFYFFISRPSSCFSLVLLLASLISFSSFMLSAA
uniref:Uncharacterized protein n=1 Tax=Arundo donax TaxID=35708 RepID=A0A0A8Z8N4_ARUDO